jgi:phage tail-like protein
MTTTLQRRPGTQSLRVQPAGWTAPEGSYVFVFGCDEAGREGYFLPDDEVSISQIDSYGSARFIRAKARLRGPDVEPPTGWRWEAYSQVFSDETWAFELLPGETRDLTDLAINLVTIGGGGAITLRFGLRLVGPGGAEAEDLEIPAFYLDDIILDDATDALIIANRSPEPGATGIPRDEAIQFDLMDTANAPDETETQVYVDGVLAYDGAGAGAQPGYSVLVTTPYAGTVRFRIVAPYLFESLREVPVRVVSENLSSTHALDESWSFTIEDLTAPRVVSATSQSHDVVRVVFDEPVEGAEDPDAYTFTRLEAPSVAVEAVSVEQISPTEYDVTLDIPITRGALYLVVVSDVEDEHGNEIVAPYDRAEFRGYECPPVDGRRFELWQMIPGLNRREDASRELYKTIAVLQEVVDLLLCDIDRWTDILDVDVAVERYVDQMLITLGNPFTFELDVAAKRLLVLTLVDMYALKGTRVGVISVIRFFLGIEVEIVAFTDDVWILGVSELGFDTILGPGGSRERYSFDVVSPIELTDEQREQIETIVEYMKPAHTHLIRIIEPTPVEVIDHLELGLSELGGDEWMLH